jgi:hypothetical protein
VVFPFRDIIRKLLRFLDGFRQNAGVDDGKTEEKKYAPT